MAISACATLCTGCRGVGPAIDLCVYDEHTVMWNCVDKKGDAYQRKADEMMNHISMPLDDFEVLINYCKSGQMVLKHQDLGI